VLLPTLIYKGPAKSIPVIPKGVWDFTRSAGSGVSIWWWALRILQGRHLCSTFFRAWRARKIQNSSLSSDRMSCTPRWWRRMCVCQINKWTKWCLASSRSGWRKSLERSAYYKRPPSPISPSSGHGLNRVIFDSLGRSAFFWSASSSADKHCAWTALIQCRRAWVSSDVSSPDDRWVCRMFRWSERSKPWREATSNRTIPWGVKQMCRSLDV